MFVSEVKRPRVFHNRRHQHVAKDSGAGRVNTQLHVTELHFVHCDFGGLDKDCLEGTELQGYFFM
jgi:hypothetical protein